ncbi:MAG: rod shape-determining protein RodA [Phocaeicola sp.]
MAYTYGSIWKSVDWITIVIYLALITLGWFSICGASYEYGDFDFFSFDARAGKQLVWIGCSFFLGFIILMLEEKLYDWFGYLLYGAMMLLLLATPFLAEDTKGSYSWIKFGSISLQPAEFAKFATAIALAKFMNGYHFTLANRKNLFLAISLILLPMLLIILQRETGSALVYLAFFLVLYREGMAGAVLFAGISVVFYFVVGIRFSDVLLPDGYSSLGQSAVLVTNIILSAILVNVYCSQKRVAWNIAGIGCSIMAFGFLFSQYVIPFNVAYLQWGVSIGVILYLIIISLKERFASYFYISLFTLGSMAFLYSADYVFESVLEKHQQIRIKVLLGIEEDLAGAGYNVNQSKIAIGSGGLTGKGFLNGTQTKLKYVPEQDTDFIFCTVGEEQGFVGSAAVLLLFLTLILRLIYLAERQTSKFGRVYGYSVLSIFFFHLFINVGMVIGLTPVIGIPLPFFSYGGSSLWGFSILLFVFLRLDTARKIK